MERCYCTKSELELFESPPLQMAIDRSSFIEIFPVASIADNPTIEFFIPGLGESYYDLSHLYLKVRAKIVKSDGAAPGDADLCAPVNYLLNTMFSECHVSLNDRQIISESNYAYKSIIEALLFHPETSQKTILGASLFEKDTAGAYDDLSFADAGKNLGMKARYEKTKSGKTFELFGGLHLDISNQSKLLINGVSLRIKLEKAKAAFCLLAPSGDYQLVIESASLFIRRCEISGSILVAHEKALESQLIQMPFTRTEIKTYTISDKLKSVTIANAVNGPLPSKVILALCSNTAYNGDIKKNPFNFLNCGVSHLSLSENGIQIPSSAYTPSYAEKWYARNYLSIFTDLGKMDTNITFQEYKDGLCFYVFDLTQDYSGGEGHLNITRTGDLSIHIKFDAILTETLTLIAYLHFASTLEVDKSRSVYTDW